ncbi:hypothetical protein JTE88_01010 [Arcanobacterium phocisimile]|uniref:Uncharacterized protein n=1 Tax=Arcanobacterium phocisimile TaxID=1302235 RepID=A0ABX7IJU5_9ACTO|nr:hypothetical protein [Arcanobacterium phocisimile]QRV02375.1 hypothetical protein JTE88_01010 [Arcanobacterium phocisimile]
MKISSNQNLMNSLITGGSIAAYYASPDLFRSRTTRFFVKTAATLLPFAYMHMTKQLPMSITLESEADMKAREATEAEANPTPNDVEVRTIEDAENTPDVDPLEIPAPFIIGAGLAACASIAFSVWEERAIFRRGERRRAEGKRLAHSQLALVGGISAGVVSYLSDRFDD